MTGCWCVAMAAGVAAIGLIACGTDPLQGASFAVVAVSPSNPRVVYAAAKSDAGGARVYRSDDGGESWTREPSPLSPTSLAVSAGDPSLVLAVAGQRMLRSSDGARTWKQVADVGALGAGHSLRAYYHPTRANMAYALATDGVFEVSTDGGATWTIPSGPPALAKLCTGISFDAANADRMYVACGAQVGVSTDAGSSWTFTAAMASAGSPIVLVASPVDGGRLWAASNDGVWASSDGGASFVALAELTSVAGWPDVQAAGPINVTSAAYVGGGTEGRLMIGTEWAGVVGVGVETGAVSDLGASLARRADAIDSVVAAADGAVFIGTEPTCRGLGGVYRSRDRGATWVGSLEASAVPPQFLGGASHLVDVAFFRDVSPARQQEIMKAHRVTPELPGGQLVFLRTAPDDPRSAKDLFDELEAVDEIECVF